MRFQALLILSIIAVLHPSASLANSIFDSSNSKVEQIRIPKELSKSEHPKIEEQTFIVESDFLAFTSKLIYNPKEDPLLFINSKNPLEIKVIHETKKLLKKYSFSSKSNNKVIKFNTLTGFKDTKLQSLKIPTKNLSGWFNVRIQNENSGAIQNIPFFMESSQKKKIVFVESTDTLKAYNSHSLFRNMYRQGIETLSGDFTRPKMYPMDFSINVENGLINCNAHLINADMVHKDNLKKLNVNFKSVSDDFLETYKNISHLDMIIFGAHNEYWSVSKIRNMIKFLDEGGKVLLLGGNTAWGWIIKSPNYDVIFGSDVLKSNDFGKNFLFNYLGSYYDAVGFDTYAPFTMRDTEETFLISNLGPNFVFGHGSNFLNCERILGISGHETDKLQRQSNGFTQIAKGNNPENGGADIIFKRFQNGGAILNFGSLSLWHNLDDFVVQSLIEEFIFEASYE